MNPRLAPAAVAVLPLVLSILPVAHGDTITFGSSRDNTLIETANGGLSNGAGAHFHVGMTGQPSRRRGLLAFDVAAAIPAGSTIDGVTLTLNMSRTVVGPKPVSLHAVLADWGEGASDAPGNEGAGAPATPGDATWVHTFYDTDLWSSPGGAFASVPSASATIAGAGTYVFGSTSGMIADVQAWIDDPASAHGWIMIGDEGAGASAKRFDTKENPLPERRPLLTVDFTPPGNGTNFYFEDADGDGYGNANVVIKTPDEQPPPGFVVDATDCDDTDPAIHPGAEEICDNGIDDDCNGVADDCGGDDCNANGVPDFIDILEGTSPDCNANGVPDPCDIASGAAQDANGNLIPDVCEVSCCDTGGIGGLTFQYTSMSCAATSHGQDPDDVTCTDFGPLPDTVFVLATDEEEPDDPDADIWFQGVVGPGALFTLDAANAGESDLATRTHLHLFSADGGTLLQSVEFRTNCSEPLAIGDQFGASLLVDCSGPGQSPPCQPDVNGDGTVNVLDLIAVMTAWSTTDAAADVTNDGIVGVEDLLAVIMSWGACPG